MGDLPQIAVLAQRAHMLLSLLLGGLVGCAALLSRSPPLPRAPIMASRRLQQAEAPHIENVLDRYAGIPDLTYLALGSSYWSPPEQALASLQSCFWERDTHRYGSILGYEPLRRRLSELLTSRGVDMGKLDIAITAGANQGIASLALALCDPGDPAVVLRPYYFSQVVALQLAQAQVHFAEADPLTWAPRWDELAALIERTRPKALFVTTPNNPSGRVWPREDVERLVELCRRHGTWLVCDQTYCDLVHDGAKHTYPGGYERVVHVFSLSKVFAMPGWRVGYVAFPPPLAESLRKLQDTVPTHAAVLTQKLALRCLDTFGPEGNPWLQQHLLALRDVRAALAPVLAQLGPALTCGAFYYLLPLPPLVGEDEAVDVLARRFGVLLMHGSAFGASGHLRLSYGSIPPEELVAATGKLRAGCEHLLSLSRERAQAATAALAENEDVAANDAANDGEGKQ